MTVTLAKASGSRPFEESRLGGAAGAPKEVRAQGSHSVVTADSRGKLGEREGRALGEQERRSHQSN